MNTALLFPGQGAQTPGFVQRLPDHSAVRDTLSEARQHLGETLEGLDSAQALASTVAVQLATLIAGVAIARALLREGLRAHGAAGLSVGAFTAAVTCNSLSFVDALSLVHLRGQAMQRAYPIGYGMAAILGLDEPHVQSLVQSCGGADAQLYLAGVNSPTQIIVSGSDLALARVLATARSAGARKTERMAVTVPSHCPLMEDVSQQLREAMSNVQMQTPSIPYVSNRGGRAVYDAAGIRDDLITNVAHPVRWHDATTVLYELGTRLFIEPPPGTALAHLAQASFGDARCVAIDEGGMEAVRVLALLATAPE